MELLNACWLVSTISEIVRNCCTEYSRAAADPDRFDHRQRLKIGQASLTLAPTLEPWIVDHTTEIGK